MEADVSHQELLRRVHGARVLLGWLIHLPCESWQQRWLASGADTVGKAWTDLFGGDGAQTDPKKTRAVATGAASRLILLDVIRPSYDWLYSSPSNTLYRRWSTRAAPCQGSVNPSGHPLPHRRSAAAPRQIRPDPGRSAHVRRHRLLTSC